MQTFEDYARYYDLFYQDKNYQQEAKEIDQLLKKYSDEKIKTILNMGCGTGRHDFELAAMGYDITGIDLSADMIKIAQKALQNNNNCNCKFQVGDVREYFHGNQYDSVISLFHVMSYQNSNEDIKAAFSNANRNLKPGGIFLFDTWYGPGVLSDRPAVRVKKVADKRDDFIRIATPTIYSNQNIVNVHYEVLVSSKENGITQKIEENHSMRYYFKPEILLLLQQAGFELLDCLDCKNLQEPGFGSWTSYFVAKKKG